MWSDLITPQSLAIWISAAALVLNYAIIAALIPRILLQRREPAATLAWVYFVLLVPFLGLVAFWALGTTRIKLRRWRRRELETGRMPSLAAFLDASATVELPPSLPSCSLGQGLMRMAMRLSDAQPTPGNLVVISTEGPEIFKMLTASIEAATHHVHLQFYIWAPDATGTRLRDALVAAAKRGVEVRILLDHFGVAAKLWFFRSLLEAGGQVAWFMPVSLFTFRLSINHRNHRKLVIIDGKLGATGGMNVGDEYAGIDPDRPWLDVMFRLEGPSVAGLQSTFAQDWYRTTSEELASSEYFPLAGFPGEEWVQVVDSGPDDEHHHPIHALVVAAIGLSRERVWIATPYFVPDKALATALETAALRGVEVVLLLPGEINDSAIVRHAARSFLEPLLSAGVIVREMEGAFLHAKLMLVDDSIATAGSANLDERSMRLNFETNAFFYSPGAVADVERVIEQVQARCAPPIDFSTFRARSRRTKLLEAVSRLMAPIL